MSDQPHLKAAETASPTQSGGGANGGNGGGLVSHMLTELERRATSLEADIKSINATVIEINAKMDSLANKTYVLTIFGITGGMAVLTFLGHIVLMTVGS